MILLLLNVICPLVFFTSTHQFSNFEAEKGDKAKKKIVVVVSEETDFKILIAGPDERAAARNYLVNKNGELSLYSSNDPFFTRTTSPAAAAEDAKTRALVAGGTCYVILRIKDPNSITVSHLSKLLNKLESVCSENFQLETRFDFGTSAFKTSLKTE